MVDIYVTGLVKKFNICYLNCNFDCLGTLDAKLIKKMMMMTTTTTTTTTTNMG